MKNLHEVVREMDRRENLLRQMTAEIERLGIYLPMAIEAAYREGLKDGTLNVGLKNEIPMKCDEELWNESDTKAEIDKL